MPETVVHFQIRMPPVLHEQLHTWARDDNKSLNALIVGLLEDAAEKRAGKPATASKTSLRGGD
jgi:predicted HicB family RNase H-like nuclease